MALFSDLIDHISLKFKDRSPVLAHCHDDETHTAPLRLSDIKRSSSLMLCSMNITQLTPELRRLRSADSLLLCCNALQEIPTEIGHLQRLTILSLSKNQLTWIPEEIFQLVGLKELDVSHNKLQGLSRSIGRLTKLATLNLEHNQIQELPQEIGKLNGLRHLKLSNNPVQLLPAEFSTLKLIQTLSVTECPLVPIVSQSRASNALSLKELAARHIIRQKIPIAVPLPRDVLEYLSSAHECSHCQGPFFDSWVSRGRTILRGITMQEIPIEYKLCISHWDSNEGRVKSLFQAPAYTASVRSTLQSSKTQKLKPALSSFSNNVTQTLKSASSLSSLTLRRDRASTMTPSSSSSSMTSGRGRSQTVA